MPNLGLRVASLAMLLAAGCATLEPPLPTADPSLPARWSPTRSAEDVADAGLPARAAADIGWRATSAGATFFKIPSSRR